MYQHLLAPATPKGFRTRQIGSLTQAVVASSAGTADGFHLRSYAVGTMLQHNAITYLQLLHLVAYLDHLTYHFVTGIRVTLARRCRRDAKTAIDVDQVQVAT